MRNLIPALGSLLLSRLQPHHIQSFYAYVLKSDSRDGKGGLSARTVHHFHRVLFKALKCGVKQGLLIRNPTEAVDPPRPENREMTCLDADQANYFVEAAKKSPYYVVFYTALYTWASSVRSS